MLAVWAVKLVHTMGAKVTVITSSPDKKNGALEPGTMDVVLSKDENNMKENASRFDFILSTPSPNGMTPIPI